MSVRNPVIIKPLELFFINGYKWIIRGIRNFLRSFHEETFVISVGNIESLSSTFSKRGRGPYRIFIPLSVPWSWHLPPLWLI